jgi:hypothetical protein
MNPITVTFFTDRLAASKRESQVTLTSLAACIEKTSRREKARLPWVKCARFGDQKTTKGSLRHNANVLAITGIEADYDEELTGFDEAKGILTRAGIAAILYTSPSHCEDAPRWRVLCPLASEYPPHHRDTFMARLNGLFGGIFSRESWILSQSYYFGAVKRSPSHRVVMINGNCIDQVDQLDKGAISRPQTPRPNGNGQHRKPTLGKYIAPSRIHALITALLDNVRNAPDGTKHHTLRDIARTVGGYLHLTGWCESEAVERLVGALPASVNDWQLARKTAAWGVAEGMKNPLNLENWPTPRARKDLPSLRSEPLQVPPSPSLRWETQRPANDPVTPDQDEAKTLPDGMLTPQTALTVFNAKHMLVNDYGKAVIFEPRFDPVLQRRYFNRILPADFRTLYANRRVEVGRDEEDKPIIRKAADFWLNHPQRRQYLGGLVCRPGHPCDPDTLNLWHGFAIEPHPGSWDRLAEHIRSVVCRNHRQHFEYLLSWMARMVQFPALPGEVAIVISGLEGTGKSTLGRVLCRLLGQHAFAISNARHLTGNFNAHLRDCVFLLGDEAFYAGDRAHAGILKALITEPTLAIEGKYRDAVNAPNFLHLMLISNADWVIPAGLEARRFCVLNASEEHVGDHAYFARIWEELEAGGFAALLHNLLARDITGFNFRHVPETEALVEQKKLSLPPHFAWWLDVLHRGYVWRSKLGLDIYFAQWHEMLATDLLYNSYLDFARREHNPMPRESFGRFMTRLGGKWCQRRNMVVGEHITDAIDDRGRSRREAAVFRQPRAHCYRFGPLRVARQAFVKHTKLPVAWEPEL